MQWKETQNTQTTGSPDGVAKIGKRRNVTDVSIKAFPKISFSSWILEVEASIEKRTRKEKNHIKASRNTTK